MTDCETIGMLILIRLQRQLRISSRLATTHARHRQTGAAVTVDRTCNHCSLRPNNIRTNLREDSRMTVEEVFIEDWVVVGKRLCQPRQSCGRYLLQSGLVRLVTDTSDVQRYSVFRIRHI